MANPGAVHTWNGQSKTIKGWADEVGVTPAGVRARIKKGLNPDGSPRDEGAAKVAQRSTKRPQHTAPERVEQLATRVDVPAVLKALGLEVRMMEGTLDGWQLGAWRATPA